MTYDLIGIFGNDMCFFLPSLFCPLKQIIKNDLKFLSKPSHQAGQQPKQLKKKEEKKNWKKLRRMLPLGSYCSLWNYSLMCILNSFINFLLNLTLAGFSRAQMKWLWPRRAACWDNRQISHWFFISHPSDRIFPRRNTQIFLAFNSGAFLI